MTSEDRRGASLARALVAATTTLAVGAGAHLAGGGGGAPWPVLLLAGALLLAAAVPVVGSGLRPAALTGYSALGQLSMHAALGWVGGGAQVTVAGHHGVESATSVAAHGHHQLVPMLLAHLCGTVVAVLLATGADRSAGTVAAGWRVVVEVLSAPRSVHPLRPPHAGGQVLVPVSWLVGDDIAPRGPPVTSAA
ncbi:MAG TPA: hypothetical protein PKB06_08110 [Actinotalea sp.]|nr:hypothetical protein [Actinotalea sp.]